METILSQTGTTNNLTAQIWKGRDGWEGRTNTAKEGSGYQITTHKGRKGLRSYAQKGTFVNGSFTFMMFSDKSIDLAISDAKCTENSIKELHHEGLTKFLELTVGEPEAYIVSVGQRLICYGYAMNEEKSEWIVYKINSSLSFEGIDMLTLNLHTFTHVRDINEKFGIGTYYTQNDLFDGTLEKLNAFVEKAKMQAIQNEQEATADAELQNAFRLQKIEEGAKHVIIPENAQFVIVAELYQNDSDSQSDYFSTSISETVILGFSSSKNSNMNELKKACLNFEETALFADGGIDFEHNDKNSYLPDYFLGTGAWSGWKVNKSKYRIDLNTDKGKEFLYLAHSEGRYFVNDAEFTVNEEKTNFEAVQVPEGEIQIVDYSEKSFAVIGETKPIKDQIKELGGKFNFRLSCGPGWIFSKTKLEEVTNFLTQKTP